MSVIPSSSGTSSDSGPKLASFMLFGSLGCLEFGAISGFEARSNARCASMEHIEYHNRRRICWSKNGS